MRSTLFIIAALLFASCNISNKIEKEVPPVIGLQPLGGFDKALMDTISSALQSIYGFDVVLLENSKLSRSA